MPEGVLERLVHEPAPEHADEEAVKRWRCENVANWVVNVLTIIAVVGSIPVAVFFFARGKWDRSEVGLEFAVVWTAVTTVNAAFQVHLHVRWYTVPEHQRRIARVLLMCPVYAIASTFALYFHHDTALYIDLARDMYEAWVLFTFYHLIVAYILVPDVLLETDVEVTSMPPPGAPRIKKLHLAMVKLVQEEDGARTLTMHHPMPLCFLEPFEVTPKVLMLWELMVLQFVVFKPLLSLAAIVGKATDAYDEEAGMFNYHNMYPYILILENLSVTLAFTCIFYMYLLMRDHIPRISPLTCANVTHKFIAIKIVIFLCFWQGMGITLLVKRGVIHHTNEWTASEVATGIQNFLVVMEMMFMSLYHKTVFSHKPYAQQKRQLRSPVDARKNLFLGHGEEAPEDVRCRCCYPVMKWFHALDLSNFDVEVPRKSRLSRLSRASSAVPGGSVPDKPLYPSVPRHHDAVAPEPGTPAQDGGLRPVKDYAPVAGDAAQPRREVEAEFVSAASGEDAAAVPEAEAVCLEVAAVQGTDLGEGQTLHSPKSDV
eukprot:TRINITY_DN1060_c2_g1_i1.p1 TRINITY_DN1060_c2_g1~~TRINITY_DN1060_c2_g1_i1.p1  ORF type:complete len:541 (+),score=154.64 TRINITY_DN1060_c2_g1_i1:1289-2911(+)